MKLRVAEILRERALTVYALHKLVEDDISRSSLYRMVDRPGNASLAVTEIAALCRALEISPNELYGFEQKVKKGKANG